MKKLLFGLVIALMMTGNGYADLKNEKCTYLKDKAKTYITLATNYEIFASREPNPEQMKSYLENETESIKLAHYYAVTYSALCD